MRFLLALALIGTFCPGLSGCVSAEGDSGESPSEAGGGPDEMGTGGTESGGSPARGGAGRRGGAGGKATGSGGSRAGAENEVPGAAGDDTSGSGGSTAGTATSGGTGPSGGFVAGAAGGSCTPPCELALGPSNNLPGESAVLVYDFETNTATLTNNAEVNAASEWVIGFSYESDPQHGYGAWSTNGWWFAFSEPLPYVEGTYSLQQNVEITSQMVNPTTDQLLRVVYSFGQETVRVHAIYVPDCDLAPAGACASPSDCERVDGGMLRGPTETCVGECSGQGGECVPACVAEGQGVSVACSGCYAEFVGCVTANCSHVCPGQGGNVCMACEAGASGCHLAFMACSGLDHMPRGTLTWPLGQSG